MPYYWRDGVKYKSSFQIFEKDMRLHETRCALKDIWMCTHQVNWQQLCGSYLKDSKLSKREFGTIFLVQSKTDNNGHDKGLEFQLEIKRKFSSVMLKELKNSTNISITQYKYLIWKEKKILQWFWKILLKVLYWGNHEISMK